MVIFSLFEMLIMLLSQLPLVFLKTRKGTHFFIAQIFIILMLIKIVFRKPN